MCTPTSPSRVAVPAHRAGHGLCAGRLTAIAEPCHARGLKLHLDGARFGNALAHLGATPAQATWQCGVDALSFGASKGGTLGAEAVIFFNPADAGDFEYRRKKGGHLVSKMRFVSAQLEAYVTETGCG